jgi:hypothetical protein
VDDLLALLALITALRVFLPDLLTGMKCLLRAGARIGVAELFDNGSGHAQRPEAASGAAACRDAEG